MALLDYVKALEGRDSRARGQQVLAILQELGIVATIQQSRFPRVRNIVVDLAPSLVSKRVLFCAHYDAYPGSPAANDNASGVAVLLGLCQELKERQAPVRVVFFDREEAWLRIPILRLGLLGSLCYVCKNDLRGIGAVYNLEFCGLGDFLGIWPVRDRERGLPTLGAVKRAANLLSIPFRQAHIPWFLFTSDHLSFRLRGFSNAFTLSLLPPAQVPLLERLLAGIRGPRMFFRRRPVLPEPLSFIHTPRDTSTWLKEDSLQLMLSLVVELSAKWGV